MVHNLPASGLGAERNQCRPSHMMRLTLLVMCLALLLLPWSCGADASVLGRCGGVLSLGVVDSGAVVVDWAFVWCAWCRLVVVAGSELQKSARVSRGIGRGLE